MNNDTQKKLLDKINKCLALAKSSNPNEAATAWRQAKALMAAHNLGKSDVIASSAITARFDIGARPKTWLVKLVNTCAQAFSCKVITETNHHKEAVIIGVGNQPEFAAYTFDVLQRQLLVDRRNFVASMSTRCKLSSKRRQGEIFAEHWVNSVWNVIARFADIDEQTDEIISAYIEIQYPTLINKTLESRKVTKRDHHAAFAGRHAGSNAKIHRAMSRDERLQLELTMP